MLVKFMKDHEVEREMLDLPVVMHARVDVDSKEHVVKLGKMNKFLISNVKLYVHHAVLTRYFFFVLFFFLTNFGQNLVLFLFLFFQLFIWKHDDVKNLKNKVLKE